MQRMVVIFGSLAVSCALSACTANVGDGAGGGGGGGGGPDGGPGGGGQGLADAAACDQVTPIEIEEPAPPDLLLVVDKSGSMGDQLQNGQQKWSVMRGALTSIVSDYDDRINFGLSTFPSDDECGPGTIRSPIAPGSALAISGLLAITSPEGGTPTHTTMDAALAYYQGAPVNPNGRYALLATDGQPNCGDPNDPLVPTVSESVTAVGTLAAAGVKTYVLGFGDAVVSDPTTLQLMAQAGGTGNYFAATSPAQLSAALDAIADQISLPSCTIGLLSTPPDPSKLAVAFDGAPVPRSPSHADGWDYDPATNSVTLYGSACDQLQSGGVDNVEVDYGCGGPEVL
jgi:Mg-chelatase subunit ChlD